jgi:sigma-B regulation protein RsbU (phosphoserine phosphatase)
MILPHDTVGAFLRGSTVRVNGYRDPRRWLRLAESTPVLLVCLCAAIGSASSHAQTFDARNLQKPTNIDTKWRVKAGDDPAWSRPEFDDSAWMLVDPKRNLLEYFPTERPEVLWYRIRVQVAAYQPALTLEEDHLSHAFEVFLNGVPLITNGRVSPYKPYTYFAYRIAPIAASEVENGSLVIALRVHLSRGEWSAAVPGLNDNNLLIGRKAALHDNLWLRAITTFAGSALTMMLALIVGVMALALFSVQRERDEYLWILFIALGYVFAFAWRVLVTIRNLPLSWAACVDGILMLWILLGPIFMYLAFLRLKIGRWAGVVLGVAAALALLEVVAGDYDWMLPSTRLALSMPLTLIAYLAIPVVLVIRRRRGNREAGILLIPALLQAIVADFHVVMGALAWIPSFSTRAYWFEQRITNYQLGPFRTQLSDFTNWLLWISLGLILVLRTIWISREEARLASELEAARQVQNVILPEEMETIPGYSVETVYRPAKQVGGDFYQVWPTPEGGLLLVVGDVAGKGLPAAMLVAVLVGSIRTLAQMTSDPAAILAEMNARLLGRTNGGFSTCLAVHLHADGSGTLACAGHPAPYVNGLELEVPGALPLGIAPCQHYESCKLQLEHGGHLTFYSDGVIEAQNIRGELLGFERARELSMLSAKEIADAASAFGQEDDITVVVIKRGAALASVE